MKRPDDIGRMSQNFENMHRQNNFHRRLVVALLTLVWTTILLGIAGFAVLAFVIIRWLSWS